VYALFFWLSLICILLGLVNLVKNYSEFIIVPASYFVCLVIFAVIFLVFAMFANDNIRFLYELQHGSQSYTANKNMWECIALDPPLGGCPPNPAPDKPCG
jgi:hypothetical protein